MRNVTDAGLGACLSEVRYERMVGDSMTGRLVLRGDGPLTAAEHNSEAALDDHQRHNKQCTRQTGHGYGERRKSPAMI